MLKFIKLTECKGNIIILNTAQIEHITLGTKGTDTFIKMLSKPNDIIKENYFFVRESVDEVWLQLTDNSKQVVIMTAVEALEYYKMKDGI